MFAHYGLRQNYVIFFVERGRVGKKGVTRAGLIDRAPKTGVNKVMWGSRK